MAFSCGQLNPFRLEPWKFNKPTLDIFTYNSKCAQTEEKIPTLVSSIRKKDADIVCKYKVRNVDILDPLGTDLA